MLVCFTHP
uniref:Uncharacterized protein n=1 Tax=Anguilla anguilla TaxID=7936 RepID=A0A0E9TDH8_ANGAN